MRKAKRAGRSEANRRGQAGRRQQGLEQECGRQGVDGKGRGEHESPSPVGPVTAIVKMPRTPGDREGASGMPSPVGPGYCESYGAAHARGIHHRWGPVTAIVMVPRTPGDREGVIGKPSPLGPGYCESCGAAHTMRVMEEGGS